MPEKMRNFHRHTWQTSTVSLCPSTAIICAKLVLTTCIPQSRLRIALFCQEGIFSHLAGLDRVNILENPFIVWITEYTEDFSWRKPDFKLSRHGTKCIIISITFVYCYLRWRKLICGLGEEIERNSTFFCRKKRARALLD